MEFIIEDFNDYVGFLYLTTEDYCIEFTADVDDAYDYDTMTWNEELFRSSAEAQVKAHFGENAVIIWEGGI